MNLTIRQLRAFREVMRSGSISEAARVLGRTQPSVSSMIANLEAELGFSLFLRKRGRLVPNPEAHYFLEEANLVLDRLAQSARTMQEIGNLERGTLRIACMPAASSFLLPRIISDFVRDRPDISVSLMMRSSGVVEELVASQQYDIGLAETPTPRGTISMKTYEMDCLCAVHRDDPLAQLPVLTPGDLDGQPMAALYRDHITYQQTEKAFAKARSRFNQRFELQTCLPALELVEQKLCYTICDRINAASYNIYRRHDPALVFIPFRPNIHFSVSILTPDQRPHSLIASAFLKLLKNSMGTLGSGTLSKL